MRDVLIAVCWGLILTDWVRVKVKYEEWPPGTTALIIAAVVIITMYRQAKG